MTDPSPHPSTLPSPGPSTGPSAASGSPAPRDPLSDVQQDLAALDAADLADQPEIYQRIHSTLAAALDSTVDHGGRGEGRR